MLFDQSIKNTPPKINQLSIKVAATASRIKQKTPFTALIFISSLIHSPIYLPTGQRDRHFLLKPTPFLHNWRTAKLKLPSVFSSA